MEKEDKKLPVPAAPRKKRGLSFRHSHIILLEIVAVVVLLMAVAAGALVWRLMSGPVDMGFAKNYIQEALRVPDQGLTPTVQDIVLSWPDLNGPLLLGFKKAKLFNAQGQDVVSIDEAALSLSKPALLIGRISPVALIVRQPVIQIVRTRDNKIVFGMVGIDTAPDVYGPRSNNTEASALERILHYIARPGHKRRGLGTLEAFKVIDAKVTVEDQMLGTSWILPSMNANFESNDEGLTADFDLQFSALDEVSSFMKGNISIPWATHQAQVQAELHSFDPWFFVQRFPALAQVQKGDAVIDAQFAAVLDQDFKPLKGLLEVASPGGKFLSTQISPDAIAYKDLKLHAEYDRGKQALAISDSGVTVQTIPITVKAALAASDDKLEGPVHFEMPEMPQNKIANFWPPSLKGDNAEEWILHKLSGGTFKDLYADIYVAGYKTQSAGWSFDVPNVIAGFGFDGMKVDYRPPMIPVTGARGKGTFNLKDQLLTVTMDSAKIADLDVTAATLKFANIIEHGKGTADLDIDLKGPLSTGLKYVMTEPINLKTKFDAEKVKGAAALKVKAAFPTRKDIKVADVKVSVDGTLSDVTLPAVVKDMDVTGGPMTIKVAGNDLSVAGKGMLGGREATFDYGEYLNSDGQDHKMSVKAQLNTDEAMRDRLGINLKDYLEGDAPADITYTEYQDGHADVDVKGDLTPGRLFIDPFDYEKKPGVAGAVTLKAKLVNGSVQALTDLNVSAPDLDIKNASLSFRQKDGKDEISKGAFPSFAVGRSAGSMNLTVEDSGRYQIKADCSMFDLGPFVSTEGEEHGKPYDNPPMLIQMTAAKMRGGDGSAMPQGRFLIDINGDGTYKRLEADASAGKGAVTLRLSPAEGGVRSFRFNADDAGAALSAFGIYKNIRGGTLSVGGKAAKPGDMDMAGSAQIKDFRVVNAPTLAKLISALSLPGMAALLGGEGLAFSKLEANYKWDSTPGGSVLYIKDGRTSGNSVGFSFDGNINLKTYTVDIDGTVVPLSDINKVIKSIPLVGDILTGGSGLIAATYSIKGPTEKPGVMVNPLSVLTPGILRRILFE